MKTCALLYTTCLLFAAFVVACAPAPTVEQPTVTPLAISTPENISVTATPWLVTATPAPTATTSPTPEATATPTAPVGEFKATNWTSSSSTVDEGAIIARAGVDPSKFWLDIVFSRSGHNFNTAVSDDVLTDIDWSQYQSSSGYVPSALSNYTNSASQGRAIAVDFLQTHVNADHHLDAQFAFLWLTFAQKHPQYLDHLSDRLFYTLGAAPDGKVWVVQVMDRYDNNNPVTCNVSPDGKVTKEIPIAAEIPKMPELKVHGSRFEADGKEIILRGAVADHFTFSSDQYHGNFEQDVDQLRNMGANFIVIPWNSGYFDDPRYVPQLMDGIKYAKARGLRVEFVLHSRGEQDMGGWIKAIQPEIADDSTNADWAKLLDIPGVAQTLAENVDVVNPLSEPQKNAAGNYLTLPEWAKRAENILAMIRSRTGQPKKIGLITCAEFGSKCQDALNLQVSSSTGFELHPYQWTLQKENYQDFLEQARQKGKLAVVGEFGLDDPLAFIDAETAFWLGNNINFAWWGMDRVRGNYNYLNGRNGRLTDMGLRAEKSFQANK